VDLQNFGPGMTVSYACHFPGDHIFANVAAAGMDVQGNHATFTIPLPATGVPPGPYSIRCFIQNNFEGPHLAEVGDTGQVVA
jgi:hypothetical protein